MSCSKDACRMNGLKPIRIAIAQALKSKRKPMVGNTLSMKKLRFRKIKDLMKIQ